MRLRKVVVLGFALILAAWISGLGGFFDSPAFAAGCQGVTPCSTVADCPCPAGVCSCVNSPSCGRLCLCYSWCFAGGDPP
jgi:hypothetical protein